MRYFLTMFLILSMSTGAFGATGTAVNYQVNGQAYEGYYISPLKKMGTVLKLRVSIAPGKKWGRCFYCSRDNA